MATSRSRAPFHVSVGPRPGSTTYYDEYCQRKKYGDNPRKRLMLLGPKNTACGPGRHCFNKCCKEVLYRPKPKTLTATKRYNSESDCQHLVPPYSTPPVMEQSQAPPFNAKNGSLWWKNYGPSEAQQPRSNLKPTQAWGQGCSGMGAVTEYGQTYKLVRPQYTHRPGYLTGGRLHPNTTEYGDAYYWQRVAHKYPIA